MSEIGFDDIAELRDELAHFRDAVAEFVNAEGVVPSQTSQASSEEASFIRPESVRTAQSQAYMLLEVSADQMTALIKTITEPVETIAPYTCVRSLLESAALAAWLLDPGIDTQTRVQRSLAFRYEGLDQQVKFGRLTNAGDVVKVEARIDLVEQEAIAMGFSPVLDRRGKRIGIAQVMPSATDLIGKMLNEEPMYRLLSAFAHGHSWAMQQLSFRVVPGQPVKHSPAGVRLHTVEKNASPVGMAYLILLAAKAFARPVWYQSRYFGWRSEHLESILDSSFDKLRAASHLRFWRTTP